MRSDLEQVAARDLSAHGKREKRLIEWADRLLEADERVETIAAASTVPPDMALALIMVTDRRLVLWPSSEGKLITFSFSDLHSVITWQDETDARQRRFAALVEGEEYEMLRLAPTDAERVAGVVRSHLADPERTVDESSRWPWYEDPTANLSISVDGVGLLASPPCPILSQTWVGLRFINTGLEARAKNGRFHLPWPSILEVRVEGIDQVQSRPSMAAVFAVGLIGLAARTSESTSYLLVSTTEGEYLFEVNGLLPVQLRARLAPLLAKRAGASAATTDAPSGDKYDRLRKIAELHNDGILTDEEFANEKARILATDASRDRDA